MEKYYITTTLPYVNAAPHIGFAMEIVRADIIARYMRLCGKEVVFNTGTDEHGLKIYRKATEEGKNPQAYVDEYAARFEELKSALNLSYTNFIRTTNPHHKAAAQELWRRCDAKGDVEKRLYKVKYCVGCELEKTDSELVDGHCPVHPNLEIELIEEENYFFKFSNYGEKLLQLYRDHPDFVFPEFRLREIEQFVKNGLADFSISRLKSKMPWGVPVPGDDNQVMYVWFDALVSYISTLGWPENEADFKAFWPGVQYAGKDNLRQQSAMWQAMLMSADLPPSKQIIINGFITSAGEKMSKSLGNVVDPFKVVADYGTDALRYWVAREANTFEDSDFTLDRFKDSYNANLANGLGNLASRILKLAETYGLVSVDSKEELPEEYIQAFQAYEIKKAADVIWNLVGELDREIDAKQPFKLVKQDEAAGKACIAELLGRLMYISRLSEPFLPQTSSIIKEHALKGQSLKQPIFPRIT